jgi:hypothetical protein
MAEDDRQWIDDFIERLKSVTDSQRRAIAALLRVALDVKSCDMLKLHHQRTHDVPMENVSQCASIAPTCKASDYEVDQDAEILATLAYGQPADFTVLESDGQPMPLVVQSAPTDVLSSASGVVVEDPERLREAINLILERADEPSLYRSWPGVSGAKDTLRTFRDSLPKLQKAE